MEDLMKFNMPIPDNIAESGMATAFRVENMPQDIPAGKFVFRNGRLLGFTYVRLRAQGPVKLVLCEGDPIRCRNWDWGNAFPDYNDPIWIANDGSDKLYKTAGAGRCFLGRYRGRNANDGLPAVKMTFAIGDRYSEGDPSDQASPLAAPVITNAVTNGAGAISVTFNGVTHADSYEIQASTASDFTSPVSAIVNAAGTQSISGLTGGTAYYIRVKAVGDTIEYVDSAWTTYANTVSTLIKLGTVAMTDLEVASATSVSFSLSSVSNASSYTVEYSVTEDFDEIETVSSLSAGSNTITGLTSGETYYIRAIAVGDGTTYGDGDACTAQQIQCTMALAQATLSNVAASSNTAIGVTIGTTAHADGYTLEYSTDSTFPTEGTSRKTYSTAGSKSISGLTAGTQYYFRVRATGDAVAYSTGPWSATAHATTTNV